MGALYTCGTQSTTARTLAPAQSQAAPPPQGPPTKPVATAQEPPSLKLSVGRQIVSRADYGEAWPFTVDVVTVGCGGLANSFGDSLGWYVFAEVDGKKYVLNGFAKMRAKRLG